MTEQELVERARDVLVRRLKIKSSLITLDTDIEELGADSLDLVTLAGEFEDVFSVSIAIKYRGNDPLKPVERVRPLCAFPARAVWDSKGERDRPESWRCVAPKAG